MLAKRDALLKSGKVPGYPKHGKKSKALTLPIENSVIVNTIQPNQLKQLLGKATFPVYLDFSAAQYQIERDDFLANCPNVVKVYVFLMPPL